MTLATIDRTDEHRLRAFGLLPSEYEHIVRRLGREPNDVELGMLGAMWSEHCSYKHSRRLLRRLPTTGARVLQGPGENAGAVDIGDGLAVVLKMESHNHPSAVEPFQGAATGVGGILRDVFTMGARPIAMLDSLRFGDPTDPRTRYLLHGVIGGIGHYGNCIGVPTVAGEISFDAGYTGNPIVNAMCVGIAPIARLTRSAASAPGSPLLLVGADTGRDGLQGAAFASNDDPEASHRGVVQVGNPFLEKLLLEACLDVLETGHVLAMQDLGAAGLTSSSVEMAARGGLGVELDVALVPRRETGLSPFEIMLSESQERMLLLVRAGREAEVQRHFARWDLHAEVIGYVTAEPAIVVRDGQETVAELPIALLTDEVPAYELRPEVPFRPEAPLRSEVPVRPEPPLQDAPPVDGTSVTRSVTGVTADVTVGGRSGRLRALLGSPELCSRRFAYRQYDSTVQGNTVFGPGDSAAAVLRVDGTSKGVAVTTDCNPRYTRLDPRRGAQQAVAEAARNLACVGARPVAVTDCLNFGNPEKGLVAWQLTEAIEGLSEACQAFAVPVVSGNVSLYNETAGKPIPPTPSVGMVGLLEDVSLAIGIGFPVRATIVLLGEPATIGSSGTGNAAATSNTGNYVDGSMSGTANHADGGSGVSDTAGAFPRFDLDTEVRLATLLRALIGERLLLSAQDVSDGGLAMALAECCFAGDIGATVDDAAGDFFAEDQGRAVVSCRAADLARVMQSAGEHGVAVRVIGEAGGDRLRLGTHTDEALEDLRTIWEAGI